MSDRNEYIQVVKTQTTRGALDLVAIERAINGDRPAEMTGLELHEATRILIAHGHSASSISARLRVPTALLRSWFPVELAKPVVDRSPAKCGTRRGYLAHRRRKEATCRPCKTANTEYDYAARRRALGAVA